MVYHELLGCFSTIIPAIKGVKHVSFDMSGTTESDKVAEIHVIDNDRAPTPVTNQEFVHLHTYVKQTDGVELIEFPNNKFAFSGEESILSIIRGEH